MKYEICNIKKINKVILIDNKKFLDIMVYKIKKKKC